MKDKILAWMKKLYGKIPNAALGKIKDEEV